MQVIRCINGMQNIYKNTRPQHVPCMWITNISDAILGVFLPLAILISRAVLIKAIRVDVKCTVMSSSTGMFISTRR